MENYKKELQSQLSFLDKLITQSEANLKEFKDVPELNIATSTCKGSFQYYYKDHETGKYSYISKRQIDTIRPSIQKEYELRVNKELHQQRDRLEKFIRNYDINRITGIFDSSGKAKQFLITPIIPTDEECISRWYEAYPPAQNSYEHMHSFETHNGEIVRSKSEKIIADALLNAGVPYSYEPRLSFGNRLSKCPDFAALNVRTRTTWYWEHRGKLGEGEYAVDAFDKLMLYERNGLIIGENLIITMETLEKPLEIKRVNTIIREYLL